MNQQWVNEDRAKLKLEIQEAKQKEKESLKKQIKNQQVKIDKLVEGLEDAISFIDRTGRCGEFYTDHKTKKYREIIKLVGEDK